MSMLMDYVDLACTKSQYPGWPFLGCTPLVLTVSWIDDNLIVGSTKATAMTKEKLMNNFECTDEGDLTEFVGSKIDRTEDGGLKFTQPVLIQSFQDEFDLPTQKYTTPAKAGEMLTNCEEKDALSAGEQTIYRSAVGKAMFLMQYSRAEIYNSVRDCARHMQMAARKHMMAIGRVMKYCVDRPNRGLVLRPNEKWDGSPKFEFTIGDRSDSDYAKDPQSQRSVSGGRVLLCGAPVTFRSSTQKTVALLVTEAELYATVICA